LITLGFALQPKTSDDVEDFF